MDYHGLKVKLLGEGCFGAVHLFMTATPSSMPRLLAVKSAPIAKSSSIVEEAVILENFIHCPNIVQSFGAFLSEDQHNVCLFLEYASGGSLLDLMKSKYGGRIPEQDVKCYVRMILQGLIDMHDKEFIHSDLKPANILVFPSSDGVGLPTLKIADFGLTMKVGFDISSRYGFRGSPIYMSPESLVGFITSGLDVWSLGCIMVEMLTGQLPWPPQLKLKDLREKLLRGETPEIPANLSDIGKCFLQECFHCHPCSCTRWSARKLLDHPYLRQKDALSQRVAGHKIPTPGGSNLRRCHPLEQ